MVLIVQPQLVNGVVAPVPGLAEAPKRVPQGRDGGGDLRSGSGAEGDGQPSAHVAWWVRWVK